VLDKLRDAGLQASIDKCEFHVRKTKYLGFIVSTDGIGVDQAKTETIRDGRTPSTVKGVQSFLGFCNFYRKFIREYGRIAKPLHRLTRNDVPFEWTNECQQAFEKLKGSLTSAPVLCHYQSDLPTKVETDASDGV